MGESSKCRRRAPLGYDCNLRAFKVDISPVKLYCGGVISEDQEHGAGHFMLSVQLQKYWSRTLCWGLGNTSWDGNLRA